MFVPWEKYRDFNPCIVWGLSLSPTWIDRVSRLCPSFGICWLYRRWCCRFCRWSRPASRWKETALCFCPSRRPTLFGCRSSRTGPPLRRRNPSGRNIHVTNAIFICTSSICSYWPWKLWLTVTPVSHGFRGHPDVLVFVLLRLFPFFSQPVVVLNQIHHLLHPLAHIDALVLSIFVWGQNDNGVYSEMTRLCTKYLCPRKIKSSAVKMAG